MRMDAVAALIALSAGRQQQLRSRPDAGHGHAHDVPLELQPGHRRRHREGQNGQADRRSEGQRLHHARRRQAAEDRRVRIPEALDGTCPARAAALARAISTTLPEAPKPRSPRIPARQKFSITISGCWCSSSIFPPWASPSNCARRKRRMKYLDKQITAVRPGGDPALHQHGAGEDRLHRRTARARRTSSRVCPSAKRAKWPDWPTRATTTAKIPARRSSPTRPSSNFQHGPQTGGHRRAPRKSWRRCRRRKR